MAKVIQNISVLDVKENHAGKSYCEKIWLKLFFLSAGYFAQILMIVSHLFISLACVKCHKKQFLCSGARCKTKFISVGNFTDRDFLSGNDFGSCAYNRFLKNLDGLTRKSSCRAFMCIYFEFIDYRFLEDVDRLAFTASHDSQRSWKRWGPEVTL